MKRILLALLLVGIIAVSGCAQKETTDTTGDTAPEDTEQPAVQQQTPPAVTSLDPLTTQEIEDAREYIRDLNKDYDIREFTSTSGLTNLVIYSDFYRITDVVKLFRYFRDRSKTSEYKIAIINDRQKIDDPSDDTSCEWGDTYQNIDAFIDNNWVGWEDEIAINTC